MKTKSTTTYKQWDIILVKFPFTEEDTSKKRPALIISSTDFNQEDRVVILQITSNINENSSGYLIQDWQEARLLKPALIKMKFATIKKSIIDKKLGKLSDRDKSNIKEYL